jgi:hypothetical protein
MRTTQRCMPCVLQTAVTDKWPWRLELHDREQPPAALTCHMIISAPVAPLTRASASTGASRTSCFACVRIARLLAGDLMVAHAEAHTAPCERLALLQDSIARCLHIITGIRPALVGWSAAFILPSNRSAVKVLLLRTIPIRDAVCPHDPSREALRTISLYARCAQEQVTAVLTHLQGAWDQPWLTTSPLGWHAVIHLNPWSSQWDLLRTSLVRPAHTGVGCCCGHTRAWHCNTCGAAGARCARGPGVSSSS